MFILGTIGYLLAGIIYLFLYILFTTNKECKGIVKEARENLITQCLFVFFWIFLLASFVARMTFRAFRALYYSVTGK